MKAPDVGQRLSGNRLTVGVSAVNLKLRIQDMHSLAQNPPYLATVSPMRCEYVFLQVGSPSKKTDLSVRSLKRSSARNKQRKWWCRVPVWLERDQGLIRTDTGKRERTGCAVVPPNALFVLWEN